MKIVGGVMNNDAIIVPHDITIAIVIKYLQKLGKLPKHTDSIFVVNSEKIYWRYFYH